MTAPDERSARLERLRGFLKADPENISLLAQCADLAVELGLASQAQGWLEQALARTPRDPYLLARLASAKLALGETDRALELLEPLVKAHDASPALRYNYGYALLRAGRYAEAKDALAAIVEHAEAPANTRPLLARALHFLGELKEAIEHALKHAEAHPDDPAAAGTLSLLYLDRADWTEARRWSERALAGQPANLDALLAAGTVSLADEKEDEAQQKFEDALKLAPANGRASAGLAMAAMMRLDLPAARAHFERAVADMPEHIGTLNALAWCQMLQKDYAAAKSTLERSMAVNRNIGDTHGGLAMLAGFQGRWDEAEQHAKRARAFDPRAFGAVMVRYLKAHGAGQGELANQKLLQGLKSVPVPGGGTLADRLTRMSLKRQPPASPRSGRRS